MKRLIESCIGVAGSRCMKELPQLIASQRLTTLNGMLPASGLFLPKLSKSMCASVSDFGIVKSNPYILRDDWAVLRDKACAQAFKE